MLIAITWKVSISGKNNLHYTWEINSYWWLPLIETNPQKVPSEIMHYLYCQSWDLNTEIRNVRVFANSMAIVINERMKNFVITSSRCFAYLYKIPVRCLPALFPIRVHNLTSIFPWSTVWQKIIITFIWQQETGLVITSVLLTHRYLESEQCYLLTTERAVTEIKKK